MPQEDQPEVIKRLAQEAIHQKIQQQQITEIVGKSKEHWFESKLKQFVNGVDNTFDSVQKRVEKGMGLDEHESQS
jgi:hypothetical protein